ncbi:MAG: hypothetical protein RSE41_00515 [Clostridia bacterium]
MNKLTANIATSIAIAIINDDLDVLNEFDSDIDKVENFMINNNIAYIIPSEKYEYTVCEITNKYAMCMECTLMQRK